MSIYINVLKLRELILDPYIEFDGLPDELLLLALNKNYLFNPIDKNKIKIYGSLNYERLEFLGDAVIDLITATLLFKNFNLKTPHDLTVLKSKLVRNSSFHCLSMNKGLCSLILKEDIYKLGNKDCADVFEAIIGALYYHLEKYYESPIKILSKWLNVEFEFEKLIQYLIDNPDTNDICRYIYKNEQELIQPKRKEKEIPKSLDELPLNELIEQQKALQRILRQNLPQSLKSDLLSKQKEVQSVVSRKSMNF